MVKHPHRLGAAFLFCIFLLACSGPPADPPFMSIEDVNESYPDNKGDYVTVGGTTLMSAREGREFAKAMGLPETRMTTITDLTSGASLQLSWKDWENNRGYEQSGSIEAVCKVGPRMDAVIRLDDCELASSLH